MIDYNTSLVAQRTKDMVLANAQYPGSVDGSQGIANYKNVLIPGINKPLADPAQFLGMNNFPLPHSITVKVASAAGGGALATTVFLLNQDLSTTFNITDNGSGGGSITYTFQDGTTNGAIVSNLLAFARQGVGAPCFGVAIRMNVTATGAGDPANLATTNPAFLTRNAFGRTVPLDLNATDDQTRGDQDTSLMVWGCSQNIARFTQLSFVMPVADTATITFYFTENFKR